jgi:GGDEF domain-containing protein
MAKTQPLAERINSVLEERLKFLNTEVFISPYPMVDQIEAAFKINNYYELIEFLERGPLGRYRSILDDLVTLTENTKIELPFHNRVPIGNYDISKLRVLKLLDEHPGDAYEAFALPNNFKSTEVCAAEFLAESKAFVNTLLMRPEYDALNKALPSGLLEIMLLGNLRFPDKLNDSQAADLLYLIGHAHEGYMKKQATRSRFDFVMTKIFNVETYFQIRKANLMKGWQGGHYRMEIQWDLNGLKDVNDKFGHIIGDQYLAFVGEAMGEVIQDYKGNPSIDGEIIAGRLGGDEIAMELGTSFLDREIALKIFANLKEKIILKLKEGIFCDFSNTPLENAIQEDIKNSLGVNNDTYFMPGVYTVMRHISENEPTEVEKILSAYSRAQTMITYPKLLTKQANYNSFLSLLNEYGNSPLDPNSSLESQYDSLVINIIQLKASKKGLTTDQLDQIKIDESRLKESIKMLRKGGLSSPSQIMDYIENDRISLMETGAEIVEYNPDYIDKFENREQIYRRYWLSEFISATGTQSSIR